MLCGSLTIKIVINQLEETRNVILCKLLLCSFAGQTFEKASLNANLCERACVLWCLYLLNFGIISDIAVMDTYSLEEEDMGDMFLTQQPRESSEKRVESDTFLGLDAADFSSPCVSLIREREACAQYSDISDGEPEDLANKVQ